jgi:hypothetical protein
MHTPNGPYLPALPLANPRNVDGTKAKTPAALTCYQCGQTGHTSWDCDLRHDVRHMTLDEQNEFIQSIMANRDAEMAAVAESMTSACTSEGTVVEQEVGFCQDLWVNSIPPLSSYNRFACLEVDTLIEPHICVTNSTEAVQTPSHPPIPTDAVAYQPGSVGYPSNM